jgi:hypothetical protein
MSDELLRILCGLFAVMELTALIPRQVAITLLTLIPKPASGFRPIGNFCAIYRAHGKVRRPLAQEWEFKNARSFFAAGPFEGAQDVVWRQAVRAETSTLSKDEAATVLLDLYKYYETIDLKLLLWRCKQVNFPLAIARLAIAMYLQARFFVLNGFVDGPFWASGGIIAGCTFATTLIRVYSIASLDMLCIPPQVHFKLYIDDSGLSATGSRRYIVEHLPPVVRALVSILEEGIGAKVSQDVGKRSLIASSKALGRDLAQALGGLAGPLVSSAANLGVDDCVGRPRRVAGRSSKQKKREQKARGFVSRLARLRPLVGARVAKNVFASGALASELFGSEIYGVSDYELLRLRRQAASVLQPSASGRSLTALLLSHGEPCWYASVAPMVRWSKEIWIAHHRTYPHCLSLPELREAWDVGFSGDSPLWRSVSGPITALRKSCERISWSMPSFAVFRTDKGEEVKLTEFSPTLIKNLLRKAVVRGLEWDMGARLNMSGRVCTDGVLSYLQSTKYSAFEKGCLRALFLQRGVHSYACGRPRLPAAERAVPAVWRGA